MQRMPNTGLVIELNPGEQARLKEWESSHGTPQQVALRCRIVLGALAGRDNVAIAGELGISRPTVQCVASARLRSGKNPGGTRFRVDFPGWRGRTVKPASRIRRPECNSRATNRLALL